LFTNFGKEEGGKKVVDLESAGYQKLLGGGKITNGYSVKVQQFTASAEEKLKSVGGEIFQSISEEKITEA
jgi:large subunit ribosomal protein L15